MLSIKKMFCFSLLHCLVYGTIIRNPPSVAPPQDGSTKPLQKIPDSIQPNTSIPCPPEKSLHSRNDVKAMIDYIYNKKSFDKIIKDNYQPKAEVIRDKHIQDLNDFTAWFENKPEHLKNILERLAMLRKEIVEPNVQKVAAVLNEYSNLEMLYNEKNDKTNELQNKFNRYEKICQYNCEDTQTQVHNITKRNVQSELYCSSIEVLHNEITAKLTEFVEQLNNDINNELSLNDKTYGEKIDEIKSKLKDKALKEFGQTMYDILNLEDEYDHFMEDITSKDLETVVYSIKSLGLHIDTKLLTLEQAIETYGQYCNSCNSKKSKRNAKDLKSERITKSETANVVNELLEIKSKEIVTAIESDWENIFKDLNTLVQKAESEEKSLENLKPIQEEVKIMTNNEKEALYKLKNAAPNISIKKILELIKKLQDLLKRIEELLKKLLPKKLPKIE